MVLSVAVFFNAPLEAPANPGLSPNPTKAPWYFAGFQELLLHVHPTVAVFVVPLLAAMALFFVPYLHNENDAAGIWFASSRGRRMTIFFSAASFVVTALSIILHDAYLSANTAAPQGPSLTSTGVFPVVVLIVTIFCIHQLMRKIFSISKNEAVQNIFAALVVAFVVLTLTGALFRGKNMTLVFWG
jgi:hypothetical protein